MKIVKIILKMFIIIIFSIIAITCIGFKDTCYAEDGMDASSMFDKAKKWIELGSQDPVIDEPDIIDQFIPVGRILVIAANAVIVVVVAIMAIRWITAKPEQQAKLKEQLIGLVVSIVVIYGAVGIWSTIKNFMEGL